MRILTSVCFLFAFSALLNSQKNTGNISHVVSQDELVQWIAQYPDENASANRTFFQKVGDLILGPKPDLIIKPICSQSDDQDNIWMLSQGNGFVIKIADKKITSVAGEILKSNHYYPSLVALCFIPDEGMLFTDSHLNQAILISEDEERITKFNKQTKLEQPTGIAYSETMGQVWIIETGAHRISIFDADGSYIKSIGQRGSGFGEFNFPTHIWIDKEGLAYVVDAMNFRIQIFSETGEYISSFGKQGDASGCLARPKGIATDSKGHIYVADALFNTIQVFNIAGDFLYYFGSQGVGKGQFMMPAGVFVDHKDYIYVSDSFNNRIQVFQLGKEI